MHTTVIPLVSEVRREPFDLYAALLRSLESNRAKLLHGDVLVVSTKYVSNAQGRVLDMHGIGVSSSGRRLARAFRLEPRMAEIIIRESDEILGGMGGFVITSADRIMAPNAGLDASNSAGGRIVLYPSDPHGTALLLHRKIRVCMGIHVGVILADSRLMPARVGTVGVAVACAGIEPVLDMRGSRDLDGSPLKVTFQATADSIATMANHRMGEGSEARPFAIVRDSGAVLTGRDTSPYEMSVPYSQCLYVRGLSGRMDV